MDLKEYYQDIARTKVRLSKELLAGKHPMQPEPEIVVDEEGETEKRPVAVYLTSMKNRTHATTAGHVCLATLDNAAQRIVEGTHRVATPDEIESCIKRQIDQKRTCDAADLKRQQRFEVKLPTVN